MVDTFKEKVSVIGRSAENVKKYGTKATAYLGKVVLSSGENPVLGRKILMDISRSHVVLICGKRGGGKSFSMAVLIEELARQPPEIKKRLAVIVIDTVGIFWTLKIPSKFEKKELHEWDLDAQGTEVNVFVPKGKLDFYKGKDLPVDGAFTLKTSDLDLSEWLSLFKLNWKDAEAVLLTRVIEKIREEKESFSIKNVVEEIKKDKEAEDLTKKALSNLFKSAESWGLFEEKGSSVKDMTKPGSVNIIDVSAYRQAIGMEGTRDVIVAILGKKIFEERMLYRKEEEISLIKGGKKTSEMPLVWMLIDEAHMFMPKDEQNIALPVLLEWVRVGRQPGLALLLATQRPNKLHPDAISQCDLFISHRMTAQPDIQAVSALRPSYLHQDFDKYYQEMPMGKGYALILDDNSEKLWMIRIRPRFSWDGGKTAQVFED
ncbi:MAG TPA: ATP-binding protein [archaeon]|nr:ATP-binding protein [archaeon]